MPDLFFTFRPRKLSSDPDNALFRRLLHADFHAANLRNVRRILVHLLAFAGLALCLADWIPRAWARPLRSQVAGASIIVGAVTLFVAIAEAGWARRRARLADELSAQDRS